MVNEAACCVKKGASEINLFVVYAYTNFFSSFLLTPGVELLLSKQRDWKTTVSTIYANIKAPITCPASLSYRGFCLPVHLDCFECQSLWPSFSAIRHQSPEKRSSCVRDQWGEFRSTKENKQTNNGIKLHGIIVQTWGKMKSLGLNVTVSCRTVWCQNQISDNALFLSAHNTTYFLPSMCSFKACYKHALILF